MTSHVNACRITEALREESTSHHWIQCNWTLRNKLYGILLTFSFNKVKSRLQNVDHFVFRVDQTHEGADFKVVKEGKIDGRDYQGHPICVFDNGTHCFVCFDKTTDPMRKKIGMQYAHVSSVTKMLSLWPNFHHWLHWRLPLMATSITASDEHFVKMTTYSFQWLVTRNQSVYGFSQWEMTLHCNVVSHWLIPYTRWSLVTNAITIRDHFHIELVFRGICIWISVVCRPTYLCKSL